MPRLGGQAVELEALFPEWVLGLLDLLPGQGDVADGPLVPVRRVWWDAIVVGPDEAAGSDDNVGEVGCRLRPLAVADDVLAVFDGLRDVAVGFQAAGGGVEGHGVVHLLPESDAGVSAEEHQGCARLAVLAGHDVFHPIAAGGGGGIQQTLDVDLRPPLEGELPVVVEAVVAQQVAQAGCQFGQDADVVPGVVQRRDAALPDLQEGVGAGGGDLQRLELNPGVGGQGEVGVLDGGRHLDVDRDDQLHVGVDVLDHVVVVLGVVEQVDVGEEHHLGRCRHVGLAGEHLAAVLGRLNNERAVAVVPVGRLLVAGEAADGDLLAVGFGVQVGVEGVLGYPALETRPDLG